MNKTKFSYIAVLSAMTLFLSALRSWASSKVGDIMLQCIQSKTHVVKNNGHYYACAFSRTSDLSLASQDADLRAERRMKSFVSHLAGNVRAGLGNGYLTIQDNQRRGNRFWALIQGPGAEKNAAGLNPGVRNSSKSNSSLTMPSASQNGSFSQSQTGGWANLAKTFDTTASSKQKKLESWESSPKAQQMAATNPEAFNQYVESQENQISEDERFAGKYKKMADADLLKANQSKPAAQQMTVSRCENIGAGEVSPTCAALLQNIQYSPTSISSSKTKTAPVVKPAPQTMNLQGRDYLDRSLAAGLGLRSKDWVLDPKTMSEAARHINSEASQLNKNIAKHNRQAKKLRKKIALRTKKLERARKAANKPVKSNDLTCFRYESQLSQQTLPFVGGLQQVFDRDCRGKNIDESKTNQNEVAAPEQKKIVSAYQRCVKEAASGKYSSAAAVRACARAQFSGKN